MSKQYNNAGRTLLIDEVIEIKGTRRDNVVAFKQQLDAQLLKRDTETVRAQMALIASDNHISVSEKNILAREFGNITANHGIIVAKSEELGITEQTGFLNYLDAYQSLSLYLEPLLYDLSVGSDIEAHQEMTDLFDAVYSKSSALEEQFFRYTTGMLGGLDYRVKFELVVKSSLGLSVPNDNTETLLSVMLLREGEDVTEEYDSSSFSWARVSEDREADMEWRANEDLTGKSLTVSYSDLVNGAASFLCRFKYQYSDTMYYSKSGFITLFKEVPGPPGEDAISVQIFSTNGNIFRDGTAYTTMRAIVFRGDQDITDEIDESLFNWERVSGDSVADESWNTSSKAVGRKTVEITPSDVLGRTVFACHVDL